MVEGWGFDLSGKTGGVILQGGKPKLNRKLFISIDVILVKFETPADFVYNSGIKAARKNRGLIPDNR